jgi:hypothetical protein
MLQIFGFRGCSNLQTVLFTDRLRNCHGSQTMIREGFNLWHQLLWNPLKTWISELRGFLLYAVLQNRFTWKLSSICTCRAFKVPRWTKMGRQGNRQNTWVWRLQPVRAGMDAEASSRDSLCSRPALLCLVWFLYRVSHPSWFCCNYNHCLNVCSLHFVLKMWYGQIWMLLSVPNFLLSIKNWKKIHFQEPVSQLQLSGCTTLRLWVQQRKVSILSLKFKESFI